MRFRIRLGKVLFWGTFLLLACLGGVVGLMTLIESEIFKSDGPRSSTLSSYVREKSSEGVSDQPAVGAPCARSGMDWS